MSEHNRRLTAHVEAVTGEQAAVAAALGPLHRRWTASVADNYKLQGELSALRRALQVRGL